MIKTNVKIFTLHLSYTADVITTLASKYKQLTRVTHGDFPLKNSMRDLCKMRVGWNNDIL